jgi:hypothetical protein
LLAARSNALHYVGGDCDVELAAAIIVEEVQWLGALHDQIVDRHGH